MFVITPALTVFPIPPTASKVGFVLFTAQKSIKIFLRHFNRLLRVMLGLLSPVSGLCSSLTGPGGVRQVVVGGAPGKLLQLPAAEV